MSNDPEDRIGGIGDPATFVMTYPSFVVLDDSGELVTCHIAAGATGYPQIDAHSRPNGANAALLFTDRHLVQEY